MVNHSQARLEECTDENLNFIECPECGDNNFSSSRGVAMHYAYNNEGSLKYLFRCEECGRLKFGSSKKNTFCSKWCEIHSKTGTFKHFDEDYLREQVEGKRKTVTEIADELGVGMKSVSKWVLEYGIGNEYECPSCDLSFATKQSVSKHHHDKHGESIAGTYYECAYCGEENWTERADRSDWRYPKYCDDDCFGADMEGDNNPNKSKERREKISDGLVTAYEEGRKRPGHMIQVDVKETGNTVDSSWEAEVDKLFYEADFDYFYNGHGEYKRYDFDGFTHAPDFVIPTNEKEIVIEVKGGSVMFFQGEKMRKIGRKMTQRDDVVYIVYGDVDLECDHYIEYGNKKNLLQIVQSL